MIPTGGTILSLDFFLFSHNKDKNVNIGIFIWFVKNSIELPCFFAGGLIVSYWMQIDTTTSTKAEMPSK